MNSSPLETMQQTLYFAYGSNLDRTQMTERCPSATEKSKAVIPGYRFIINSRGVASVVVDESALAEGLLWNLTKNDEERLDRYEGVSNGHYEKHWLDVILPNEVQTKALVYIATISDIGKPRPGYLEKIIDAAKCLEMSSSYIEHLQRWHRDA
jgi:cation transport regulator ChaC